MITYFGTLVPVFGQTLLCLTCGLILKMQAAELSAMLILISKTLCLTHHKAINMHTEESNFQQLVSCSLTLQSHKASVFISDMGRLKCMHRVSDKSEFIAWTSLYITGLVRASFIQRYFMLHESNDLKPVYSMFVSPDRLCLMQFGTHVQNIHCFYAVLKTKYQQMMQNGTVIMVLMTSLYYKHFQLITFEKAVGSYSSALGGVCSTCAVL